jgi:hypothetical protein
LAYYISGATNPISLGTSGLPLAFYGIVAAPDNVTHEDFYVVRQNRSSTTTVVTPVATGLGYNIRSIALTFVKPLNRLYAFYNDANADNVYFKYSDDYGDSWSDEQQFDNTVNAIGNMASSPVITSSNGRLFPIWEESVVLVTELNSVVAFESEPTGNDQEFPSMLDRFVGGLGLSGDSGDLIFAGIGGVILAIVGVITMKPIVWLCLELIWFGVMTTVSYIAPGLYISMIVVFGGVMLILLLRTFTGGNAEEI